MSLIITSLPKQITGIGEARNHTRLAVERTVPSTSPPVATELVNGTSIEFGDAPSRP